MARIRVAIAGFGFAGSVRHRLAYERDPRAEIVGVLDPLPARRDAARRLGLAAFATPEALAAVPADVWSVCSPPDRHAPLTTAALRAGCHVLLEKPMAPEPSVCRALDELARRERRILALGHNFLCCRAWMRLRRWLDDGRLGTLRAVQAVQWSGPGRDVPLWTRELRGGLLFDELPHHLYLLADLLGNLEVASAWYSPDDPRLEAALVSDRGTATVSAWLDAPRTEWWIAVGGSRGSAMIDLFRDAAIWIPGEESRTYRTIVQGSAYAGAGMLRAGLIQALRRTRGRHLYGTDVLVSRFLDAVTGKPAGRLPTSEDGIATMRLLTRLLDVAGVPPASAGPATPGRPRRS